MDQSTKEIIPSDVIYTPKDKCGIDFLYMDASCESSKCKLKKTKQNKTKQKSLGIESAIKRKD